MTQGWKLLHLGVVVKDMARSVEACRALGAAEVGEPGAMGSGGVRTKVQFVRLGDLEVEFFEHVEGQSTIGEFLARHGEGVHHMSFEVADLDAELARLKGVSRLVMGPRETPSGRRIAFVELDSLAGMQVELEQLPRRAGRP